MLGPAPLAADVVLHPACSHAAGALHALRRWRAGHADLPITLARGNHADRAGDPPADLGAASPWPARAAARNSFTASQA